MDSEVERIDEELEAITTDIEEIQEDITSIKDGITAIEDDITSIKDDITSIEEDITNLQDDADNYATKATIALADSEEQVIDFPELFTNIQGIVDRVISLGVNFDENGRITFVVDESSEDSSISSFTYNILTRDLVIQKGDGEKFTVNLPQITETNDGLMTTADYKLLKELEKTVNSMSSGGLWRQSLDTYEEMIAAYPGLNVTSTNWLVNDYVYVNSDSTKDDAETSYIVQVNETTEEKTLIFRKVETVNISTATNTSLGIVKGVATGDGKIYVESDGSMSLLGYDGLLEDIDDKMDKVTNPVTGNLVIQDASGQVVNVANKPGDFILKTSIETNEPSAASLDTRVTSSKRLWSMMGGSLTTLNSTSKISFSES